MKEEKSDRIDRWIESRLGKLRKENQQISTNEILIEIQSYFQINIDKRNEKAWKGKILKIRKRIHKRHEREKKFCEDLARELILPVELIQRWVRCGWIIPSSENGKQCLTLFREFEYYRRFKPERIPQDIEIPIWAD